MPYRAADCDPGRGGARMSYPWCFDMRWREDAVETIRSAAEAIVGASYRATLARWAHANGGGDIRFPSDPKDWPAPTTEAEALALLRDSWPRYWPEAVMAIASSRALADHDLVTASIYCWHVYTGIARPRDRARVLAMFAVLPVAGANAPIPSDPGRCYRGLTVPPKGRQGVGLSWTPHYGFAVKVAHHWAKMTGGNAVVLSTVPLRDAVVACLRLGDPKTEPTRVEYIVDPAKLGRVDRQVLDANAAEAAA